MNKSSKIFILHLVSWDFLIEIGSSMRQWLKNGHIAFEQKGNNFYVLNADGHRTGEIYSLVSEPPTSKAQQKAKHLL